MQNNKITIEWIKEVQADYKENRSEVAKRIYENKYCRNLMNNNIEKFSTYFGMPEYDSLNSDGNLRDELTSIAYEQLVNSLINFDTDKCQARYSKNITSGILSYLQLENKHTLAKAKIEMASSLYPRITSYYQELLILAHKGGLNKCITSYNVEDVTKAINIAKTENRKKTISKGKTSAECYVSNKQAEAVMRIFSINPDYTPQYKTSPYADKKAKIIEKYSSLSNQAKMNKELADIELMERSYYAVSDKHVSYEIDFINMEESYPCTVIDIESKTNVIFGKSEAVAAKKWMEKIMNSKKTKKQDDDYYASKIKNYFQNNIIDFRPVPSDVKTSDIEQTIDNLNLGLDFFTEEDFNSLDDLFSMSM